MENKLYNTINNLKNEIRSSENSEITSFCKLVLRSEIDFIDNLPYLFKFVNKVKIWKVINLECEIDGKIIIINISQNECLNFNIEGIYSFSTDRILGLEQELITEALINKKEIEFNTESNKREIKLLNYLHKQNKDYENQNEDIRLAHAVSFSALALIVLLFMIFSTCLIVFSILLSKLF